MQKFFDCFFVKIFDCLKCIILREGCTFFKIDSTGVQSIRYKNLVAV